MQRFYSPVQGRATSWCALVKKKGLAAVQSWPQPKQSLGYSKILNTIWQLKKQGYADSTLKAYDSRLRIHECVGNQQYI